MDKKRHWAVKKPVSRRAPMVPCRNCVNDHDDVREQAGLNEDAA
jgi:hypothetical protein